MARIRTRDSSRYNYSRICVMVVGECEKNYNSMEKN
jgi:hypothetical protein